MFQNRFTVYPNPKEVTWGLRYLLFQQAFLSYLLALGLGFLNLSLTNAEFNFLYFSVNFLAILWIFRKFLKESFLHTVRNAAPFALAVILGLCSYEAMNRILSDLIYTLLPDFFNVNDATISLEAQSQFTLTFIGAVFLVPLAEETLFRGLLFTVFRRRSRILAYAVSSALFCAIHVAGYIGQYEWWVLGVCFLQYVPAGIALAWSFETSGSIYAPILIHTLVNLTATLSMR